MPRRRKRVDPAAFGLPVEDLRRGAYSHSTALLSRDVLVADGRSPRVMVQIIAEQDGLLGGTDEAIALLKLGVDDWSGLVVQALYDGDRVEAGEAVLTIEGEFPSFAHIAHLCLGVLSRRTRVSTNARALVEAARPKPVIVLPARHDHWLVQPGDALAAQIGGAHPLASRLTASGRGTGTPTPLVLVPHALISAYCGDTVAAVRACVAHTAEELKLIVPVDYENQAIETSLAVARTQESRLWGVQLATSEHLVDQSIIPQMGAFVPTGVNSQLVWNVRNALDAEGYGHVKILVSGTFDVERIRAFENDGVPADAYGIGAAFASGRFGFLADVVAADGQLQARAGAGLREHERLERVK
jgi:nicotinate phosphoribosyltransferase